MSYITIRDMNYLCNMELVQRSQLKSSNPIKIAIVLVAIYLLARPLSVYVQYVLGTKNNYCLDFLSSLLSIIFSLQYIFGICETYKRGFINYFFVVAVVMIFSAQILFAMTIIGLGVNYIR